MAEVYFYHMTQSPLEATLPSLLAKTRAKGWRALVRSGDPMRLDALEARLWSQQTDATFLPIGREGQEEDILLTADQTAENDAEILFLIDGANVDVLETERRQRVCLLFDGNDPALLDHARAQWKIATDQGVPAVYWAQGPDGWHEKMRKPGP